MSDAEPPVFAHLTAPGRGGIAVIRCVGSAVAEAMQACFRPAACDGSLPAVGRLAYGHVLAAAGEVLDEVILHRAGPQVFEVNCHGGPVAVGAVCDRLAALGLVRVEPDALLVAEGARPIEREGRRLLRAVPTERAARVLLDQLGGALGQAVAEVRDALAVGRPAEAVARLDALLDGWRTCGRWLADPPRVAIAGRPNVGKSTLLNRLAGYDRAITAATAGTTRDYVEAVAAFDGLPVLLVDTAGLREAEEAVEREGVTRAREQAAGADLVVYLLDGGEGAAAQDVATLACLGNRALAVWNKADLAPGPLGPPAALAVSALAGDGLDALRHQVLERLDYRAPAPGTAALFTDGQEAAFCHVHRLVVDGRCAEADRRLAALLGGT